MTNLVFDTITIENFKTFSGTHTFQLKRQPGLYYITGTNKANPELGANGVGKSTIWDALTWVLWDRTGRDNRPADAVKPWTGKGRTEVCLRFIRDGETFSLLRSRNPNRLTVIALDSAQGKELVQKDVPKLLGMSEEMFRRTLVLGQFGTLFLDLKPEAQAQMFTEALQLDVWLRAIDLASERGRGAQRAADQAAANMQTNDALLVDLAQQITDQQGKAEVFTADQAARVRKGQVGVDQLVADVAAAQAATPDKPALPDDTKIQQLRDALGDARDDANAVKAALAGIVDDRAKAQRQLAELNKPKPKCGQCGQVLPAKAAEASVDTLHTVIAGHTKQENRTKVLLQAAERLLETTSAAYAAARTAYDKEKETYTARLGLYETAIRKVSSIQGELKRWRDQLATVKAETNLAEAEVDRLRKRRGTMRATGTQLKESHEAYLAQVEDCKFWQDGFREIRLSIIDHTLVELEMATARHAAMLGLNDWQVKFDTSRETKAGTVSYAFSVLLYPPGQDQPIKWESYSGGESQRWQLATAFALSEVLLARAGISPNIEVLDEPTRGLSAGGVDDLLGHLADRARELGRAIYFVDHHSLDKGAFDGTLVVTKGAKGSTFAWQ